MDKKIKEKLSLSFYKKGEIRELWGKPTICVAQIGRVGETTAPNHLPPMFFLLQVFSRLFY
jgi:hypothetical protein